MKNVESFKLTDSQKELKLKIEKFLDSPEKIFRIIGKPGVGKTTMTKIGLEELINADIETQSRAPNINVAGIALSHQAKKVLGEHIPNVFTFAKAYGLKEVINIDGSRTFEYDQYAETSPIGEWPVPVFVHDEVSQYTPEMLRIVQEKTPIFSKIIFMGDKAQLPPIDPEHKMAKDADSPVFDIELPEECQHELTERVRQAKGNSILDLSDVIREEIFGNQNIERILEIIRVPNMKKEVGYSFISYPALKHHMKGENHLECSIIAFRNNTVDYFNHEIREFALDSPDKLLVDRDVIRMTNNYYHFKNDDLIYTLNNSDLYRVDKIYNKFVRFSSGYKNYKIPVYAAKLEGEKLKELIVPTEIGYEKYDQALEEMSKACNSFKMKWDVFWDFKKKFCECSYGYATTAYKAQGSTYDSVYVDINDIILTKPLTNKRKLQTIYTAITRARYSVYFLKCRV